MKTFLIEVNEHQLQVLGAALGEMPYRVADLVIKHLNSQVQKQLENTVQQKYDENEANTY